MQGDYIPSGDPVNDPDSEFFPAPPDSPPPENGPTVFTPPPTFDDPDLMQFQLNDGPYLDLHTDRMYFTLIRFINPENGWGFPSIPDLIYRSRMQKTAVRKYLKLLCEPKEKGGLGKFTRIEREPGSQSNAYFLNAWATGLVPEPMNAPCDDPLGEALRLAVEQVQAEKDWHIETRDLHIEQLRAQVEALGATPVTPDEPLRHADPSVTRTPLPPPAEPPPPHYPEVDQWVAENWARLKAGGIKSFVAYREWVRKYPGEVEIQAEKWRAADQAERRADQSTGRDAPEELAIPVWDGPSPEPEAEQLWSDVLDNLQTMLPRPIFETWLRPTTGIAIETGDVDVLVVAVPTPFAVEWLGRRMFQGLQAQLQKVADKSFHLRFVVRGPVAQDDSTEGGDVNPAPGGD